MFKRKAHYNTMVVNGSTISVDDAGADYISSLERKLRDKDYEIEKLHREIEAMTPILTSKDYKPALSADCEWCKYVVRSPFSEQILGCRKQNVCEDFEKILRRSMNDD